MNLALRVINPIYTNTINATRPPGWRHAFSEQISIRKRGNLALSPVACAFRVHNSRRISTASATHQEDTHLTRTSSMEKDGRSSKEHKVGSWYSVPELSLRDHRFSVPLNYKSPGSVISVFAREVVGAGNEEKPLPYLLYLQGGPGFESPRPQEASGWLKKACEEYRVVLLDQRGTGLSTPLTVSSLSQFSSALQQADYVQHFRADNIINDAEFIRVRLVPNEEPWTVLGQSFGGFCGVTYLSFAPKGLKHVLLTGGLPPIDNECTADAVYRAGYKSVLLQNQKYYERFPQDKEVIHEVVLHLAESDGMGVPLPSGGLLTPWGLQLLGLSGLGTSGGFERLHYMFEKAWDPVLVPGTKKQLSYTFKREFENSIAFDTNPLYAMMHEMIYCQGAASRWSAHRIRDETGDIFNAVKAAKEGRPVFFTGEMVFPWMFDEIGVLRPFKEAAHMLAEKKDWPPLYDTQRLRQNQVPVAAAVYYEDMYVNVHISQDTAAQIAGIRLWITNEFRHSGIRDSGSRVFDYLMGMLKGKNPVF